MIHIWTDGSSCGSVGPGGWAAIIKEEGRERHLSGGLSSGATNNSMEMMAVLKGLANVPTGSHVIVHTDSKLVIGWLSQNWRCKFDPHQGDTRSGVAGDWAVWVEGEI